ncbi:MAG: response regulator [bacterium]|nr:response regulator [bacterium]
MFEYDQEILNEFIIEANELLGVAEEDILEIEVSSDQEIVNRIFRAFHTVKGNAAMIGLDDLAALAHEAEDMLTKVRSGVLTPDKTMTDLLLKVVDSLKQLLEDAKGGVETSVDIKGVVAALKRAAKQEEKGEPESQTGLQPEPEPEPPPEPAPEAVAGKAESLKILVAEDDYTSRKIIRLMLSNYGHVDGVVNGEEAVDAFRASYESSPAEPYHLVCMDIMMPELDGMEAVKQIRAIERELGVSLVNECVIFMTTALDDPKTVIRSLYKSGATAYLVKPVNKEDLEKELHKQSLI